MKSELSPASYFRFSLSLYQYRTHKLTYSLARSQNVAFFLLSSLEATSSFLSDLLEPQVKAFETALETDPLAELDDFMMFKNLPEATKDKLDQRQDWVKRVWRVR